MTVRDVPLELLLLRHKREEEETEEEKYVWAHTCAGDGFLARARLHKVNSSAYINAQNTYVSFSRLLIDRERSASRTAQKNLRDYSEHNPGYLLYGPHHPPLIPPSHPSFSMPSSQVSSVA